MNASNRDERNGPPLSVTIVTTGSTILVGGDRYTAEFTDASALKEGDFVFVPPYMPHVEVNLSVTEDLVWLTTRTPDNIVINLPEVDDSILVGFRRA